MSIPVELDDLAAAIDDYGWAYVLTVGDDQRAHIVAASPRWTSERLVFSGGRRTAANATARPNISLCYPPPDPSGYSLIVDGTASIDGQVIEFAPTGAVLHRPARDGFTGSPTGCDSDCAPVNSGAVSPER
jgi:hypothetical protein